jgi:hypothetical protein
MSMTAGLSKFSKQLNKKTDHSRERVLEDNGVHFERRRELGLDVFIFFEVLLIIFDKIHQVSLDSVRKDTD